MNSSSPSRAPAKLETGHRLSLNKVRARPAQFRTLPQVVATRIDGHWPILITYRKHALDHHEPYGVWGGTTPKERALWSYRHH